jgi:hypothetical protein
MAIWNCLLVRTRATVIILSANAGRFFYALISFFGILAFVGSLHETEQASKTWFELSKATGSVIWACMCGMPRVLAYLVLTLVWALPEAIFRCLPLSVKGPVRQARRSVWKTGLGAEQKVEMKMTVLVTEVKTTRATKGRFQGGEGQNTPLAEFLGIYDMLMLVTQELHYIDIMRLSRVSRSVREAVLPPQDYNRRLDVFKMYTCPGEEKACCWACNSQICTVSLPSRHISSNTDTHNHRTVDTNPPSPKHPFSGTWTSASHTVRPATNPTSSTTSALQRTATKYHTAHVHLGPLIPISSSSSSKAKITTFTPWPAYPRFAEMCAKSVAICVRTSCWNYAKRRRRRI